MHQMDDYLSKKKMQMSPLFVLDLQSDQIQLTLS